MFILRYAVKLAHALARQRSEDAPLDKRLHLAKDALYLLDRLWARQATRAELVAAITALNHSVALYARDLPE